ncbi:hypothetical protein LBMAG52_31990 [Planctomycetia bacterium]|nr:hypothetical protein LBMAG52_31990 [Planctomycetia bacterium]
MIAVAQRRDVAGVLWRPFHRDFNSFAEAEDKVAAGMGEKTLVETVFLVAVLLDSRFPSGIFC